MDLILFREYSGELTECFLALLPLKSVSISFNNVFYLEFHTQVVLSSRILMIDIFLSDFQSICNHGYMCILLQRLDNSHSQLPCPESGH